MYRLAEEGYDGVVTDPTSESEVIAKKVQAMGKSYEWGDRIPTGVFYQARFRTYEEELEARLPQYADTPLIDWDVQSRDVSGILATLR
jgi:2-oxoglutarate ferredoxin oxidoreductase subunit beta